MLQRRSDRSIQSSCASVTAIGNLDEEIRAYREESRKGFYETDFINEEKR